MKKSDQVSIIPAAAIVLFLGCFIWALFL